MKVLKFLSVFSIILFLASCTTEELVNAKNAQGDQEVFERNIPICNPEPVTFTTTATSITINSVDSDVNFLAVHLASNYAFLNALCDPWNGGAPDCAANLSYNGLDAGVDYLLKVSGGFGSCWIPFTAETTQSCLAEITSSGGTITVECLDPSVTRLDIHNVDYTVATPVSALCNPWSGGCSLPIVESGFSTGTRLLRIEQAGTVTWEQVVIN